MRRHKFMAGWRDAVKHEVEIVEEPTAKWFKTLAITDPTCNAQAFRFSLLSDGALYFADAMTVLHHDIMEWKGPDAHTTQLLVGIACKTDGPWRMALVQHFGSNRSERERFDAAGKLLKRMDNWRAICAIIGDPFENPRWGEETP